MQWSRDISEYQTDAIRITVAIFILSSILKCIAPSNYTQVGSDHVAVTLVRNGEQFFKMAQQDQLPAYRLKHVAMAIANLQTARQVFDDATIERLSGIDVHSLLKSADALLNELLKSGTAKKSRKALPLWP